MAERRFQAKLQQLRKQVTEEKEMEKRARAELERKKVVLADKKTKYLRLKLKNDQLDVHLEIQSRGRALESARGAYYWDKIEKEVDDKIKKMDGAMSEWDAEKQDESVMVLTYLRAVEDIPKKVGFEGVDVNRKVKEIGRKRLTKRKSIQEQKKKLEAENTEMASETALRQDCC